MHLTALNTSLERCIVPLFIEQGFHETVSRDYSLDREQTTVLRIHCSIGCFHKSCTFFSVPYDISEVKPTTCFAVIRERFAIWLKVQLPRAANLVHTVTAMSVMLFKRTHCHESVLFIIIYIYIYICFFFLMEV